MSKLDELIRSLPKKEVVTKSGPVQGYIINGICVFKGIPYAAAPEGDLRWRPPQPRKTWSEPLSCLKNGNVCPQDSLRFPVYGQMGEDCLNLNIWTPEKPAGRCTVMVWLHGGGFSTGAGSLPIYDGSYFASQGAVVVTLNYRLNVLGYLAHPELTSESGNGCSGNYGMMDQIFALKWIKENIAGFGGDPDRVTIFGESAGGASVVALMSSPLAVGLFHRAIAQSPGYTPYRLRKLGHKQGHLESAEAMGILFAESLGLKGNKGVIEKMRQMPAEQLSNEWFKIAQLNWKGTGAAGSWMLNHLIIDGHVLHEAPGEVFRKGKQHNVPFLIGTNADEGTLFEFLFFGDNQSKGKYLHYVKEVFINGYEKVVEHFGDGDGDRTRVPVSDLMGSYFQAGARRLARSMANLQPQTYRYLFNMPPKFFIYQIPEILEMPDWQKRFGVYHAAEIPYVFHFMALPGMTEADKTLSEHMAAYWARFAATGDPNGEGAKQWPRYSSQDESYILLDDPISIGSGYMERHCDCVDEVEGLIV